MQIETIQWGILGCGNVTEVKSGPALQKVPGSSVVAVMRRDGPKAADYAQRHGIARWYDSAEALIHDPQVNAVYIATPPGSHCELALQVAAAGKPCYVEKPMARNATECQKMIDAFTAADRPLFVAYYRRGLPHFNKVKSLIDNHQFGALRSLHYRYACGQQRTGTPDSWRFQPELSGGGLFWDLGSHALDLFDWWLGPLQSVRGHMLHGSKGSLVEELVAMTATTDAGVSVSGDWNFISSQYRDQIELQFEQAQITCSVFGSTELRIVSEDGEEEILDYPHSENIQFGLISNVVECLQTGSSAWSTADSATRTNAVIDKIAKQ